MSIHQRDEENKIITPSGECAQGYPITLPKVLEPSGGSRAITILISVVRNCLRYNDSSVKNYSLRFPPSMTSAKDTPPSPLQLARFSIPSRAPNALRRPRLIDFLHENIHRKVIFVAAAAGYGKTALLSDFVLEVESPVVWCQLDDTDRDAATFAEDAVTAVRHLRADFQSNVTSLAAQRGTGAVALASALARDIASAFDDYVILVLDNFHLVQDSEEAMRFMDTFVPELPEQIHLLIAGRAIPGSPVFTQLAITDQIAGLDEDYLRFTPEEVQALLQQRHNLDMPRLVAEELTANTEGWITAILMSTYSMWRGMTASTARARESESVYGFLAEEVLDQQPPPMKTFLLESSVLPDMDVEICDEVLERTDSEHFLKQAEERHLFVNTVGDEFRAYQYHNLFRDFLSDKLRSQDPQRLALIQQRAAHWYYSRGMIEAAVTFYMMAGCVGQATQIIEAQAVEMFSSSRYATLNHWADQLGEHIVNAPRLNLMLAIANTDRGRLDFAEERLKLAQNGFELSADEHGSLETQMHQSSIWYRRGEFEQGLELANASLQKAIDLKRDDLAGRIKVTLGLCLFRSGKLLKAEKVLSESAEIMGRLEKNYDLASVLNDLALVLNALGKSEEAQRAQQQALELWREQNAASPLANILNNIGWNLHLMGQHESALATYAEALEWARRGGNTRLEVAIFNGQSEVFADIGDYTTAYTLASAAIQKSERVAETAIKVYLYRSMARLERLHKNWNAALEWIERAKSLLANSAPGFANVEGLRGMIWVERGEIEKGIETLVRACDELERSQSLIDLAQAYLFRACAEFRSGNKGEAIQSLTRALAAAQGSGYDQMLISEVGQTLDLFKTFSDDPNIGARLRQLMIAAESAQAMGARLGRSSETLSAMDKKTQALHIEVRALGQSAVYKNGVEITKAEWVTQKTRELFLFIVDQTAVTRNDIVTMFWGDKSSAQGVGNFHQTLYRLRRAFGMDAVVLEKQEYRISPEVTITYDAANFESQAAMALAMAPGDLKRLNPLSAAIQSYSGEYLADVTADWAVSRRESLHTLYLNVAGVYADELMNFTRYNEARDILRTALKVESLRDDLHRRMLVCLHKMGRRHEVVKHYLGYCDLYRNELGLPPSPEIQSLYSRLIQ